MSASKKTPKTDDGFSIVEIILTMVIVTMMSGSISLAFQNLSQTYALARQLNEIYAVLSSCPEIDRALQFENISGATNCFPNNVFQGEGTSASTITYSPSLTVNDTTSLASTDPLYNIYDSKVVNVSVARPGHPNFSWNVRLLVTRGGIGQQ